MADKVDSAQPKRWFTRRARSTASLKSGGGGVVAELSTKKSVDSSKNWLFSVEYRDLEIIRRFGHKSFVCP